MQSAVVGCAVCSNGVRYPVNGVRWHWQEWTHARKADRLAVVVARPGGKLKLKRRDRLIVGAETCDPDQTRPDQTKRDETRTRPP